ncbi:MAG: hypothetical protein J7521_20445 [Caulobacter sp.]|nr:hypothetical protein [Caulobacter sp.]
MAGVTRDQRLSAYISASSRRAINYADGWDCAAGFVARWIEQERSVDPAEPWRGRYANLQECLELLDRSGGLHALMERGARHAGLVSTASPRSGDVGVLAVCSRDGRNQVAGIRTILGWAVLTFRGVAVGNWSALESWSV